MKYDFIKSGFPFFVAALNFANIQTATITIMNKAIIIIKGLTPLNNNISIIIAPERAIIVN